MDFAQPLWVFIGFGLCTILALIFRFMGKKRRLALERFASQQLLGRLTRNVSTTRRRYKNILVLLGIMMCFIALARPQYGHKWVEVKRKGIDLLFALDTSKSMLAEDIKPYRLKRAKLAILDFVQQLEGDRVGLMPFAGSAYLMCPLTLDYEAFAQSLATVTTDIIPRGGTNIGAVIDKAVATLSNGANHKILIVLTDGENLEGDALKAAEEGSKQGLTIYTVGVGTSEGELIPLVKGSGKGFVKDTQGNFVTSRLDETTLTAIAEKSSGLYVPLGTSGEGLQTIYQEKLSLVPKEELAERRHKVPLERFEWPLAAALIFLTLDLLLGDRKKLHRRPFSLPGRNKVKQVTKMTGLAVFIGLGLGTGNDAYGSKGEEAFSRGDYLQASEYYSSRLENSPDDPQLNYNYGSAAHKNNMYDDAVNSFTKALKSDNVKLQEMAYYNRGNSHYAKGVETLQGDPEATSRQWQQALDSLKAAIELNPQNNDAIHNHAVIKNRLEELKKQQENKKDQQQDQQNDQNQEDGQQSDQSKDQQQGDDSRENGDQQQSEGEEPQNKEQQTDQQSGQSAEEENSQQVQQPEKADDEQAEGQIAENSTPAEDGDEEKQAAEDEARQQLGKMTKEEAERLLNALKNEEGELNFVPSGGNDTDTVKDW
ncbi:MAG: VWA domain-containing protein [Desulforhopalus sp.]